MPPVWTMRAGRAYAALGALLGLGAPLGYAVLRRVVRRWRRLPPERANGRMAYAYLAATTPLVFAAFGHALGRREERLRRTHAELTRMREEFAAIVAHDLRNPIQTILLQTDVLLRQARPSARVTVSADVLRRIARSAERLAWIVNDLLDASRIEAHTLGLDRRPTDVGALARATVDRMRPTLGPHPIAVVGEETLVAHVDPGRLDQVLTNLLENAAKYSPPDAPITLRIRREGAGVAIDVEDRGPGIPPDELPRLFDRYYQSRRARAHKTGLGLGLYISRGLVEAHGGTLRVASSPGQGSVFTVWLPGTRLKN